MGRPRKHPGLLLNVYPTGRKAKPYQLKYPDSKKKSFATLGGPDGLLIEWNKHYGDTKLQGRVSELCAAYIAGPAQKLAPGTVKDYTRQLAMFCRVFGEMQISDVTPTMLYQWQDIRGEQSAHQCNREKAAFSNVCRFAMRKGLLNTNPCRDVRKLPEPSRERDVTREEFWLCFNEMATVMQAAMLLCACTGMRPGDIRRLTRANWKLEGPDAGLNYTENKSKKGAAQVRGRKRFWPMTDGLRRAYQLGIESQPRTSTHWLLASTGRPFTEQSFSSKWRDEMLRVISTLAAKGVELERFQFRDIRAHAANEAEAIGGNEAGVALLQHATPDTTRRVYTNRRPKVTKANF